MEITQVYQTRAGLDFSHLRCVFRFISQAQKLNNSGFASIARNRKKIGTDLYLDCSFTFKFPAVANNFSRDIVVEFFINALRLADFWLPPKIPKYSLFAGNLMRFP